MPPDLHTCSIKLASTVNPSFVSPLWNLCLPGGLRPPPGQLLAGPYKVPGGAGVEAEGAEGAGAGRGSTPGWIGTASPARSAPWARASGSPRCP